MTPSEMLFFYGVYGLIVQTDRPIPGLNALSHPPDRVDVAVFLNSPADAPNEDAIEWRPHSRFQSRRGLDQGENAVLRITQSADGRYTRLAYRDGSHFTLDQDGAHVWVTYPQTVGPDHTWQYILNPILGFCLRLREIVCLHASAMVIKDRAVLIAGASGAGKSTLTSYFALHQTPILSDDLSALERIGSQVYVRPSYPILRLWPTSITALFGDQVSLPTFAPHANKRYLDLKGDGFQFAEEIVPVDAVYLVQNRGAEMSIKPLSPPKALVSLMNNAYMHYLLDKHLRSVDMKLLAHLAETVAVRELTAENDLSHLPDLYNYILRDLDSLRRVADGQGQYQ